MIFSPKSMSLSRHFYPYLAVAFAVMVAVPFSAFADVVFEEVGKDEGGTSQPGMQYKFFISGEKFRAQKKMNMTAEDMQKQQQETSQRGAASMEKMRMKANEGRPSYPARIITFKEWQAYPENAKLMDALNEKGSAASDGKANLMKGLGKFGPGKMFGAPGGDNKTSAEKKKDAENAIWSAYNKDFMAGIQDSLMKIMSDKMMQGEGLGALMANSLSYDDWLRSKIIKDYICVDLNCANKTAHESKSNQENKRQGSAKIRSLAELEKITDTTTEDYKTLKLTYSKDPAIQAEYAKEREKKQETKATMKEKTEEQTEKAIDGYNNMQMSAQIVRLDQGKIYEIVPPNEKVKNPTASDICFKEQALDELKAKNDKMAGQKEETLKKMKQSPSYAQRQAANAVTSELVGTEAINGVSAEHWKITSRKSDYDFWVAANLPGAQDIIGFEKKCREKVNGDRRSFSLAVGGVPNTSDMMTSVMPNESLDAEIAKITAKGLVVKRVVRTKQAAQGGRDISGSQPGAQGSGTEDMVSTFELHILKTTPIDPKAFELPEGAKKCRK